jgi:hypothetical protein
MADRTGNAKTISPRELGLIIKMLLKLPVIREQFYAIDRFRANSLLNLDLCPENDTYTNRYVHNYLKEPAVERRAKYETTLKTSHGQKRKIHL